MFSETPEETWARTRLAGQARHREIERKRGRPRARTCRQAAPAETTGRASGGWGCNLNANDLFQGGMSKGELTRWGSNAGTPRPPSASLHSQTYFTASSRPRLPRLSGVNCLSVESCWHFIVKHLMPSQLQRPLAYTDPEVYQYKSSSNLYV